MKNWWIQRLINLKDKWQQENEPKIPVLMNQITWKPPTISPLFNMRLGQFNDIDQFESIEKLAYNGYIAWRKQDFIVDWKNNPYCMYLVIEQNNRIIGLINGRIRLKGAHISQVMVIPEFQGMGLGNLLIEEWLKIANQLGAKQVTLEVRKSNDIAKNLYHKFGFKVQKEIPNYYYNNRETAIVMCLRKES